MGIIKEFKDFAMRGNVMDMAVGIIIGGAFGKIVSSLVKDIIMPPIGWAIGGMNFSDLSYTLGTIPAVIKDGKEITAAKTAILYYGNFLQTTFDFLIVAFAIFMMIKLMNKATEAASNAAGIKEEVKDPTEKDCPKCCTKIAIKATRCPHCTSEI